MLQQELTSDSCDRFRSEIVRSLGSSIKAHESGTIVVGGPSYSSHNGMNRRSTTRVGTRVSKSSKRTCSMNKRSSRVRIYPISKSRSRNSESEDERSEVHCKYRL